MHDAVTLMGRPVLAMIETARAVIDAAAIAAASAALIAGTNDLSADLGVPLGAGPSGAGLCAAADRARRPRRRRRGVRRGL